MGKTVVALYDMTGIAAEPWAEAGYGCYCFDVQNTGYVKAFPSGGFIKFIKWDAFAGDWLDKIIHAVGTDVAFMFAWPPCTDLAVSGARHFASKLKVDPLYRQKAMSLVYKARDAGELFGCPYIIENPVSVISTEWRKPDYTFHPYKYGGYLPEDDQHPRWPEYIAARDAYPKKTCYWVGSGFIMPKEKPVQVDAGYSNQYKKLGGKSLKTKNIRSATPRGISRAIFQNYGELT